MQRSELLGSRSANRRAALLMGCLSLTILPACAAHRGARSESARGPNSEALGSYIEKVREASAAARPSASMAATIEATDPQLSAALTALAVSNTGEAHRRVAVEYRRVGVLDLAYKHLTSAIQLDSHDAAAYDGLARIWRDWGVPRLGLGDAYRAVALAPASASAANTLGTLLEGVGETKAARHWYERALELNPRASYALVNICYSSIMLQRHDALDTCRRAVVRTPESSIARNNLALAYVARGDFAHARAEFEHASGSVAEYNLGIAFLATHKYRDAVEAFDASLKLDPSSVAAAQRAQQARASVVAEEETRDRQ
jgi:tetratricopeptide (TPR) repeat protein